MNESRKTPFFFSLVLSMLFPISLTAAEQPDIVLICADDMGYGVFNIGLSQGELTRVADPESGREVLKLDYTMPPGTVVGVWTNGMYCHGVQWLVKASRILADQFQRGGDLEQAAVYRETCYRLWRKISPLAHTEPGEIEVYGGQPNKQAADMLTTFDPGRMIWSGYTGAAGWMLRQACEGIAGADLVDNEVVLPDDLDQPRRKLTVRRIHRNLEDSPLETT